VEQELLRLPAIRDRATIHKARIEPCPGHKFSDQLMMSDVV